MPKQAPKTRLAARRQQLKVSQAKVAELSGLSLRTIQRLERGEIDNPPIRYLTNLALVLDCSLRDVCEDEWLSWTPFSADATKRPDRDHWLPNRRRVTSV
jgi:transcriptional regulator with XRE-family HTH domain